MDNDKPEGLTLKDLLSSEADVLRRIAEEISDEKADEIVAGHTSHSSGHSSKSGHSSSTSGHSMRMMNERPFEP